MSPPSLTRVLLRFPRDSQIRYVEHVPEPGDQVSGLAGERFVVSKVTREGKGFIVDCRRRSEGSDGGGERQAEMTTDDADAIRIAANENVLRERNERMKQSNAHTFWVDPPFPDWTCECGDVNCSNPIHVTIEEYEAVRAEPTRFIIAPGLEHVASEVERVVQREGRYWIVEKVGVGAQMSKELDPRSGE